MHFVFKLKIKTKGFDNFNFTGNAEKKLKICCISLRSRTRFNMFQILTTKGKGMVVGNPAPGAHQGSSGSPVPVLALQGSWWLSGESPERMVVLALLWPFWSVLKSTEEQQTILNIKHQGKYWQGCGEVILLLHKYLIKCDLNTVGHDCTWQVEVNYF